MKTLSLLVCCLLVGPASGQAPPEVLGRYQPPVRAADSRQMTEDIEIMRRILGRAIGEFVGPSIGWRNNRARSDMNRIWTDFLVAPDQTSSGAGRPNTAMPWRSADGNRYPPFDTFRNVVVSTHAVAAPEGAYLKGYGVVYSVTLPGTPVWPEDKAAAPAPKPQTEWDRIRQELHGEKPKKADEAPPKSPPLSEVLVKLLAENGRHFRLLAADEKLTIVVTFRPEDDMTPLRGAAQDFQAIFTTQPLLSPLENLNVANKPLNTFNPLSPASPSSASSVKDLELLGDLQLRQGKYPEALAAFKKALELTNVESERKELYRRLAQAYLGLGGATEEARKRNLEHAAEMLARVIKAKADSPPAAATSVLLPSRLIVSAPKKLLDAVAAGQMTFDDFRRGATIEMIRPQSAGAPGSGGARN